MLHRNTHSTQNEIKLIKKNNNKKQLSIEFKHIDLIQCRLKLKKAIKKLIIIWKLCKTYVSSADKPLNVDVTLEIFKDTHKKHTGLTFDSNSFKESKTVPEYIKKILKTNIAQRTDDVIRIAANGISALVSKFEEYPFEIRLSIVKYAFYEEYEPGRVLLRQGKRQTNFYFIIQGLCAATKIVYSFDKTYDTFAEFCTVGQSLGEKELIYKAERKTTVTTSGSQNVCLLAIQKDDFFHIIEPLAEPDMKINFLIRHVPLLNSINYPFQDLNISSESDCCATYFRSGKFDERNLK
jgi:hypothetical protein